MLRRCELWGEARPVATARALRDAVSPHVATGRAGTKTLDGVVRQPLVQRFRLFLGPGQQPLMHRLCDIGERPAGPLSASRYGIVWPRPASTRPRRRYCLFSPQTTIKAPSGKVRGSMRSASRATGPADGKNTAERMLIPRTAIPENSAFTSRASCHRAPR